MKVADLILSLRPTVRGQAPLVNGGLLRDLGLEYAPSRMLEGRP